MATSKVITKITTSVCTAHFLHYTTVALKGDKADGYTKEIVVQKEIRSFEYTKNISNVSGAFTLQLTANYNWKKRLAPGDWVAIYISNEGKDHLRMIGNIDRISQFTTKNDKGLLETQYVISGRDFGKVLEEYQIWFNPYEGESLRPEMLIKPHGTPTELIEKLLELFLAGKANDYMMKKNNKIFTQNLVPIKLNKFIKLSDGDTGPQFSGTLDYFYNFLSPKLQKLSGYKVIKDGASYQGNLWSILKKNSNESINELFLEINDENGEYRPTIYLRMRPFVTKKFNGQSIQNEINYFENLKTISINGHDIIGTDVGYSDEERFNFFLMIASSDLLNVSNNIYNIKDQYPKIEIASVQRNGLKMLYNDTEFALMGGAYGEKKVNPKLLLDWNRFLFECYNNSVFMEAGTIDIERANPEIRVGKTVIIRNAIVNENKIFYIEGYTDSWEYPYNWRQTLNLTRGHHIDSKGNLKVIVSDNDSNESTIYTGQTVIDKSKKV